MMDKAEEQQPIVSCQYCHKQAELVTGKTVYPHRNDLYQLTFWMCKQCGAYVGTHKNTHNKPLGILANDELRKAKRRAHADFDPLWRNGNLKRKDAYKKLSEYLGIERKDCHIGLFEIETCIKVCEFVKAFKAEIKP